MSIFLVIQSFTAISQAGTKADLRITDMGGTLFSIEKRMLMTMTEVKKFSAK
ncbi:MAG: hypothetical protein ACXVCN_10100 [Bdellovibrio sp.]